MSRSPEPPEPPLGSELADRPEQRTASRSENTPIAAVTGSSGRSQSTVGTLAEESAAPIPLRQQCLPNEPLAKSAEPVSIGDQLTYEKEAPVVAPVVAPIIDPQATIVEPRGVSETIHPWKQPHSQESATRVMRDTVSLRPREIAFEADKRSGASDYEVRLKLGEGGMGSVFRATQSSMDRDVAIKMIKAKSSRQSVGRDALDKFLSEAVVTGGLEHPNIVPIYDVGVTQSGDPFYVMKEVRGLPWSKSIDVASEDENLTTLLQVAHAIAFAHARGVVHRDLKPDNIMLGEFGEVLVLDWGLAFPTEKFPKTQCVFVEGLAGTPAYMAPEMAFSGRITEVSDVYLLGAILFRMLVGKPPHSGTTVAKCLQAAQRNEFRETTRHDELMSIAFTAMSTRPEDRYPSALAFQQAIREYRSHAESRRLTDFAEAELREAGATADYRIFEKVVLSLEQAIELWRENTRAKELTITARLDYAQRAFDREDFDLAEQQLDAEQPRHLALLPKIRQAKQERDQRLARFRRMKRVAAVLAVVVFVTVSVASILITRSRNQERLAKTEALRRFQQSQTAIDRLTAISDQIRYLPRLQSVRSNLLNMVAGYYEELTDQPSQTPEIQLELTKSLIRLGDVHSLLSEHRKALQVWEKASQFADRLRASPQQGQIAALSRQAKLRSVTSLVSLHEFEAASRLLTTVQQELTPSTADSELDLAQMHFQQGLLLREMGQMVPAIKSLLVAEEVYRRLADRSPESRQRLATTLSTLGQLYERNGDAAQAQAKGEQALAIGTELYELDPSNPDRLEGVAISQMDLANSLRSAGHDPIPQYRAVVSAYTKLVRARPEIPHYEFNLATAHLNLASLLARREQTESAKTMAVEAINGFIRLANQYPEDIRYQDRETEARISLAEILRDRSELELAEAMLTEATKRLREQLQQQRLPQYREQLALATSLLAQIQSLSDMPSSAKDSFLASIADWDELLNQESTASDRVRDSAAWTRFHFARWLADSGDEAQAHFQADAAMKLRDPLPANAAWDEGFAWLLLFSPNSDRRDSQRAFLLAQRAVRAASDNPRLWLTLALAELRLKKLSDCEISLKKSQELIGDPFAAGFFVESLIASARGQQEMARDQLQQATESMLANAPAASRLILLKAEATSATATPK